MGNKHFLLLKIVATQLTEVRRLITLYEERGFKHADEIIQEDKGLYWAFVECNRGLINND